MVKLPLNGCCIGASGSVGTGGTLPRDPSGEHRWEGNALKPKAHAPYYRPDLKFIEN